MTDGYRFTLGGATYVADITKILLSEWIDMEKATGAPPVALTAGMDVRSAIATRAFLWVARRHAGESKLRFDQVDFPLFGGDFKVESITSAVAKPAEAGRGNDQPIDPSTGPESTPPEPSDLPTT